MKFQKWRTASDILCVFVTKLRLRWFMDVSSNQQFTLCVSALKLVLCSTDSFLTLWNNESDKGGLAHSQHGSLQRFPWACEHVFSLSKTLLTLYRTLGWTCAIANMCGSLAQQ